MAHPKLAVASSAGKNAAEIRWHGKASDQTKAALAEAQLEDYISRVVSTAPALPPDVRDRLALLLSGAAS